MKNTNKKGVKVPKGTYARKVMVARVVARTMHKQGSDVPKEVAMGALEGFLLTQEMGRHLARAHKQGTCPHLWWNNKDGTWVCIMCELEGVEGDDDGEPLTGVNL